MPLEVVETESELPARAAVMVRAEGVCVLVVHVGERCVVHAFEPVDHDFSRSSFDLHRLDPNFRGLSDLERNLHHRHHKRRHCHDNILGVVWG